MTFCKLNLKVEYECLVWNFIKSNNDTIKKAIELVNWNFTFSTKSIHETSYYFSSQNEHLFKLQTKVDDKDPPWMNESIKKKIMARKYACKYFNVNKKNYDVFLKLQTISTTLPEMILKRNANYYCLP